MTRWLDELCAEAYRVLPAPMARYVLAGAREEVAMAEATAAWADYRLLPRVLTDVGAVSTASTLLGSPVATPIGIAPTSMQRAAHPDGEQAMARGAADAGAMHVVSSNAGWPFDRLRTHGPWWLQLYLPPEREAILPLVQAAIDAGATALVLTADTPAPGTKYAVDDADWAEIDLSWHRANVPSGLSATWARDLTIADIAWLQRTSGLPVVVKGVLRADDAQRCVQAGAAAIWVSNHGGRQLDRAAATAHALPVVVAAVPEQVPVYVDGGVRSGLDALTALALGAEAVFLGRAPLWALAVDGAPGVHALLDCLTAELVEAMLLSGAPTLEDTRGLIARKHPKDL